MVRYEVELMLHLCLINKKEHDTIIKTLTFRFVFLGKSFSLCFLFHFFGLYFFDLTSCRLDQFVKEGLIENQFNLFHLKTKDEALQQETALADHQTKPDANRSNNTTRPTKTRTGALADHRQGKST